MQEITDYGKVFETLVEKTTKYLVDNNIKAQILGISGGIDSTVVAAICHEVSKRTNIPLIGRSLPTKFNKEGEITTADLVGKAFCDDFEVYSLSDLWEDVENSFMRYESKPTTPISSGNIQARLRMIYLYNLASVYGGLVMDTDNLTENNLGYFTIHGDVGDFNPIGGLWKTEVFKLAEWYKDNYVQERIKDTNDYFESGGIKTYGPVKFQVMMNDPIYKAITESLKLKPTAGLGITNNDLEEIGAESYEQVDRILKEILKLKELNYTFSYIKERLLESLSIGSQIIENVLTRHFKSEFKRKQLPIKITRNEILL